MKSFRADSELERRLAEAAAAVGETESELIRRAVMERADMVLQQHVAVDWSDVAGVVHGPGNQASRAHEAFGEALVEEWERKAERRRRPAATS